MEQSAERSRVFWHERNVSQWTAVTRLKARARGDDDIRNRHLVMGASHSLFVRIHSVRTITIRNSDRHNPSQHGTTTTKDDDDDNDVTTPFPLLLDHNRRDDDPCVCSNNNAASTTFHKPIVPRQVDCRHD